MAPLGIVYGIWAVDPSMFNEKFREKVIKGHEYAYFTKQNAKRLLLFLIPLGIGYVTEKKIVPGNYIVTIYFTKSTLFLFFMIAYFWIYPRVWARFGVACKSDIFITAE